MTLLSFTYPHIIDGVTIAEYDGCVDVLPISRRRPDPEDDYKLEDLSFEGSDAAGKSRDVPVPAEMRGDVIEWLERTHKDELAEKLYEACQDHAEREYDRDESARELCAQVARELRE